MKITTKEACDLLYRGKSNVPEAASRCGLSGAELRDIFKEYAKAIPLTDDAWQGDVYLSWPWA